MSQSLTYYIFDTSAGWIGVLRSASGLREITLPCHSAQEARNALGHSVNLATTSPDSFDDLVERFHRYFRGDAVVFPGKLDLSGTTDFQRDVWEATRLIPFGETRSYTWISEQINKPRAMRAVGQALGRNPLPIIIPCHRILNLSGSLGGYSGGLEMKRYLLALES